MDWIGSSELFAWGLELFFIILELMLHAGTEAGEIATTMLVPMRFVWPHGGTVVFLNGSFTGWSNLLPMSAVEGCPTVFQAICNLTPGYYQYKFCVDGEWRHDDYQPHVTTTEYGVVNTIVSTLKPDYVPAILSSEVPPGSNMDVDNEAFQRVVRISGDTFCETVPRISEFDMELSRRHVSKFLSTNTVYELLPESGKVIALDVNLPVQQAFHILYEQGISMAPLWDFIKGQFVGILSALDFVLILRELGNHGPNLTEEDLASPTISTWKDGKIDLNKRIDGHGRAYTRHLIVAGPNDNLRDVAGKILEFDVATVPVIQSSSQDGSYSQLLHLASLSGILKCLCRYFRHCSGLLPVLQLPIYALPVGTWVPKIGETNRRPLAMLRPNASLTTALDLLVQAQVSSIPIVDDNDSLLDIYSRSDITALAKDRAYAHINLNKITINQALQLGQDTHSSPYEFRSKRYEMCLRSDSLHKVMERLANPGIRRLVIVEAGSKRVEGIISLTDIFKLLLV